MPDVKEVYEQVARQAPAPPDPLARQLREQRRHLVRRRSSAFAVAACIGLLAVVVFVRASHSGRDGAPLRRPSPSASVTMPPLPVLGSGSYVLNVRTGETVPFGMFKGGHAWAPSPTDPQRYAFNRDDGAGRRQVWVGGLDEAPRQLTDLPNTGPPIWSPDGRWLAFDAGWDPGPPQVYVVDVASGKITQITHEREGAAQPSWTPDGGALVYSARRIGDPVDKLPFLPEYWIVRQAAVTVGGNRPVASDAVTLAGSERSFAAMPDVSPDGKLLAYVHVPGIPQARGERDASLWLLNLRDGRASELVPPLQGLGDPRWSPDGRTLSFEVDRPDDRWETWTVDIVTGEIARISSGYPFAWEDADHVHVEVG